MRQRRAAHLNYVSGEVLRSRVFIRRPMSVPVTCSGSHGTIRPPAYFIRYGIKSTHYNRTRFQLSPHHPLYPYLPRRSTLLQHRSTHQTDLPLMGGSGLPRALCGNRMSSPSPYSSRTVVVLGASYGGARAARLLSQALPNGWRLLVIDRNSHMNRESSWHRHR